MESAGKAESLGLITKTELLGRHRPIASLQNRIRKRLLFRISCHSTLDPFPCRRCLLFHTLGILLKLLHSVWRWNIHSFLNTRSLNHSVLPCFQSWELLDVNASPEGTGLQLSARSVRAAKERLKLTTHPQ